MAFDLFSGLLASGFVGLGPVSWREGSLTTSATGLRWLGQGRDDLTV